MDKTLKKVLIADVIAIFLAIGFFFTFFLLYPHFAFVPAGKFFKVFPEYDIPIEEIEYIEVSCWDDVNMITTMRKLNDNETMQYIEKLNNMKLRINWIKKLRDEKMKVGNDYLVVFHKKNGEVLTLHIKYEGDPTREQRINDSYYYGESKNNGFWT